MDGINTSPQLAYCCICGNPIEGHGNDPEPILHNGGDVCCDACNERFVIPARMAIGDDSLEGISAISKLMDICVGDDALDSFNKAEIYHDLMSKALEHSRFYQVAPPEPKPEEVLGDAIGYLEGVSSVTEQYCCDMSDMCDKLRNHIDRAIEQGHDASKLEDALSALERTNDSLWSLYNDLYDEVLGNLDEAREHMVRVSHLLGDEGSEVLHA